MTNPDTDPYPDHDTGKTCLSGGMHCPGASVTICTDARIRVANDNDGN